MEEKGPGTRSVRKSLLTRETFNASLLHPLPPFLLLSLPSFRGPCPLFLSLSREGLYSPYFCVVITRRTDHGRIYALFQIDLLYLILTPSRRPLLPQLSLEGVDAFARTLSFFFF